MTSYWIGLVGNQLCSQTSYVRRYHWVGNDACTSAEPLNVTDLPNRKCQAVAISLYPGDRGDLPRAAELDCSDEQKYICQYEANSKDITFTNTVTSTDYAILSSVAPTASGTNSDETTAISDALTSSNAGTIVEALVAIALLLCISAFLLWFYKKRRAQVIKNEKGVAPSFVGSEERNSKIQPQNNHDYCK